MLKWIKILGVALIVGCGIWYLFIKEYDYKISFKTKQAPGIVYYKLLGWNNWQFQDKVVSTLNKTPYKQVNQEFHVSDTIIGINWEILRESDSITVVNTYLRDVNNSFEQKLKVLFTKTNFVTRSLATVKRIQTDLSDLNKKYKVGKVTRSSIPRKFCAYISLESKIDQKANLMMSNNYEILTYLQDNGIEIEGTPFLEVTKWDELQGIINFNFCFPISKNQDFPESDIVKFKTTEEKEALKAKFNGNYRISDCAWFTIIDYAERRNIQLEKLPIEFFYNDPHYGGNELDWEAEIYIPLKK